MTCTYRDADFSVVPHRRKFHGLLQSILIGVNLEFYPLISQNPGGENLDIANSVLWQHPHDGAVRNRLLHLHHTSKGLRVHQIES